MTPVCDSGRETSQNKIRLNNTILVEVEEFTTLGSKTAYGERSKQKIIRINQTTRVFSNYNSGSSGRIKCPHLPEKKYVGN